MTAEAPSAYRLGEFHAFQAARRQFLYLVPSGGIFEMDETAAQVVNCLMRSAVSHEHVRGELLARGIPEDDAQEAINELYQARALLCDESISEPPQAARAHFPLQTLLLSLTNQCNLSSEYCSFWITSRRGKLNEAFESYQ